MTTRTIKRQPGWHRSMRYHIEYGAGGLAGGGVTLTDKIDPARLAASACRVLGVPCEIRRIVPAKTPGSFRSGTAKGRRK